MASARKTPVKQRPPVPRWSRARRRFREWQDAWRDPALTILALLLVVTVFVILPLQVLGLSPLFALVMTTPMLIAAVAVVSDSVAAVVAVLLGTGLIAGATVLHFSGSSELPVYLHLVAGLVVVCALCWVVARAVFAPGRVTYHRILGTFLLYLTIGLIFSSIYGILGLLLPHAFTGIPPRDDATAIIAHAVYFSFSTLTTAGYGDITPSHPITRGLSNLEAVTGQLFPATVIARIVTLHLVDRHR
jgi:Ion channel